jgi:hypothetical protein
MNRTDTSSRDRSRRRTHHEIVEDCYEGVDLAPRTLDSLVTWDVSGHARREQDRLSVRRLFGKTRGGY